MPSPKFRERSHPEPSRSCLSRVPRWNAARVLPFKVPAVSDVPPGNRARLSQASPGVNPTTLVPDVAPPPDIAVARKLERLRSGQPPRVLDLFAGCGGLSLGLHRAGFHIAGAIEKDMHAARSHGLNFHDAADSHSRARDVATSPAHLVRDLDLGPPEDAFDVIVGGPPCQAFARVGRPKLREIYEHPQAFLKDPRARLFIHWLNYVDACRPLAVLMENVPDVLNHGGQNIAEETCDVLRTNGYVCSYTLLNASMYSVPQMRERMFLLGYRHEVARAVRFPSPTNRAQLPTGYDSSRAVTLKALRAPDPFRPAHNYLDPPRPSDDLPPPVTARDAIDDLPPIYALTQLSSGALRRGARRLNVPEEYRTDRAPSPYADQMRTWPSFEAPDALYDHVIRYLPRDYKLFRRMKNGDQYPEAHRLALEMFEEELAARRGRGSLLAEGSGGYRTLMQQFVPPYDAGKFPNKWRKMWTDEPARTLMAHLGKDSYSHIHYDSEQARTISVREAARLQSFPDGFRFSGTMNPAFRQIGNAVPPLLARALAEEILRTLRGSL